MSSTTPAHYAAPAWRSCRSAGCSGTWSRPSRGAARSSWRRRGPGRRRWCRSRWPTRSRAGRGGRAAAGRGPGRGPADGGAAGRAGRRPGRLQRPRRQPGRAAAPGSRWSRPGCWCGGCSATRSWPASAPSCSTSATSGTWTPTSRSAFLVDVRAALRPDLRLLATSATADAERLAELLGGRRPGRRGRRARCTTSTVVVVPAAAPVAPPHGLRVDPRLLDHVAATVRRALAETDRRRAGVPARRRRDRRGRRRRLGGLDADVLPLHGRLPAAAQDAALRAGARRRVVLATAVAESSLTVPGVRVVVDAGLARVPRTDLARGLGSLVTVRGVAGGGRPSAPGGPAGRARARSTGAGRRPSTTGCRRTPEPEVAVADLTGFALELACWGHPAATGLALLDPPPAARDAGRAGRRCAASAPSTTTGGSTAAGPGAHRRRRAPAAGPRAARRRAAGRRAPGRRGGGDPRRRHARRRATTWPRRGGGCATARPRRTPAGAPRSSRLQRACRERRGRRTCPTTWRRGSSSGWRTRSGWPGPARRPDLPHGRRDGGRRWRRVRR